MLRYYSGGNYAIKTKAQRVQPWQWTYPFETHIIVYNKIKYISSWYVCLGKHAKCGSSLHKYWSSTCIHFKHGIWVQDSFRFYSFCPQSSRQICISALPGISGLVFLLSDYPMPGWPLSEFLRGTKKQKHLFYPFQCTKMISNIINKGVKEVLIWKKSRLLDPHFVGSPRQDTWSTLLVMSHEAMTQRIHKPQRIFLRVPGQVGKLTNRERN